MSLRFTFKKSANYKRRKFRESSVFLVIFFLIFGFLAWKMSLPHMLNTFMQTAYKLLLETVFYIMAITVMTGAISKLFVEFGVVDLLEKLLRPLMKPFYNMPGVASLGAVLTFLSDNPAIITLAKDKHFSQYFKKVQLVSLTNFGTAFGMGLVVIAFMASKGFAEGALIGLVGAIVGSIVSTRLMQFMSLRRYPELNEPVLDTPIEESAEKQTKEDSRSAFMRTLDAILDGGKSGVEIGVAIIPGVLVISTMVMMLTFGPQNGVDYAGVAYEGVPVIPWLAGKIDFVFDWLFGFKHTELIAFPMTALGAVGAALGLIPTFDVMGLIDNNAIAVFTAMGMCWSGYLSTHTAMLDSLGYRHLISTAIKAHTVGGLIAGIFAHWLYFAIALL